MSVAAAQLCSFGTWDSIVGGGFLNEKNVYIYVFIFWLDVRLCKHHLEKLRQELESSTDHGETYKFFPYAYWAISQHAVLQSLSKMPDVDEKMAFQALGKVIRQKAFIFITAVQGVKMIMFYHKYRA